MDKHKRPENYELVVARVNTEIVGMMDYSAKATDLRIQKEQQQKMLLKATSALTKVCNVYTCGNCIHWKHRALERRDWCDGSSHLENITWPVDRSQIKSCQGPIHEYTIQKYSTQRRIDHWPTFGMWSESCTCDHTKLCFLNWGWTSQNRAEGQSSSQQIHQKVLGMDREEAGIRPGQRLGYLFIYDYSPVNRAGSPRGFLLNQILHKWNTIQNMHILHT